MTTQQEIHIWARCHHCGMAPISGAGFRCETCPAGPEADLCQACCDQYLSGQIPHPAPSSGAQPGPSAAHRFTKLRGNLPQSLLPWLQTPCPKAVAPQVPRGFLIRPEFRVSDYSAFAAYGFVIRHAGKSIVLTALHVMDEISKYKHIDTTSSNPHYSGMELPGQITSVCLYDVLDARWMLHPIGEAGPMLVLPNARTGDDEPLAWRDIAAFHVKTPGALTPIKLAGKEPKVGDVLWLAARMTDGSHTRRVVCVEVTSQTLVFRYDDSKTAPTHLSGSAILDGNGEVVGINTGLGRFEGKEFGHANPLGSILSHLTDAL